MTELERFERLKEMGYTYNPETGEVFGKFGKVIKGKSEKGYIKCSLWENKKQIWVLVHRFIWWISYGEVPKEIDHINRVKGDNRLFNLRNVSHSENKKNTLGKGYSKSGSGFEARIMVDRKLIHLGTYKTKEQARERYLEAKKLYHNIDISGE
jgi:hypothetical protein